MSQTTIRPQTAPASTPAGAPLALRSTRPRRLSPEAADLRICSPLALPSAARGTLGGQMRIESVETTGSDEEVRELMAVS